MLSRLLSPACIRSFSLLLSLINNHPPPHLRSCVAALLHSLLFFKDGYVTRVYVPRFFVSSQQRFGVTDIKALGASQLSGLGQIVLQLLGKSVLQLHFI